MTSKPHDISITVADATKRARAAGGQSGQRAGSTLNPAEFGARLQEHARALWCIAVGVTGNRTAAEDLVQEAAVVALGKLEEFDARTSFTAWMGQIVRFLALNERRRWTRERDALGDTSFANAVGPKEMKASTRALAMDSKGRLLSGQGIFDDELAAAVRALDEVPRCCLLLRVVMDLPYREIAHILAIPEGTAMSHVHRARRHVRDALRASPQEGRAGT